MNDYLIQLQNIEYSRQGRTILSDVNLEVNSGEIITLIGPNGAGKSTLLKLALGLSNPNKGQRIVRPNLRVGYMPQHLSLPDTLPLTLAHFLKLAKGFRKPDLLPVCERLHIGHLLNRPMQKLSGGELQRALLARALLIQPQLLVLDEPVQGLDVAGQSELYELIAEIRTELQCGVLMVSHDLHLVMAATDRVICLNGHICCEGHPHVIQTDPSYLELFGKSVPAHLAPYTHHHNHTHDHEGCEHHISSRHSDESSISSPHRPTK